MKTKSGLKRECSLEGAAHFAADKLMHRVQAGQTMERAPERILKVRTFGERLEVVDWVAVTNQRRNLKVAIESEMTCASPHDATARFVVQPVARTARRPLLCLRVRAQEIGVEALELRRAKGPGISQFY